MTDTQTDGQLTQTQLLVPVGLIAVALLLLFAFQTTQITQTRDALHEAKAQQEKAYEDGLRVQNQLNALVVGTHKLAVQGDRNAQQISEKLKQLGVTVNATGDQAILTPVQQQQTAPPQPDQVPAAEEKQDRGPVKP